MMLLGRPYTDENGSIDDALIDNLSKEDKETVLSWIKENIKARKGFNRYHSSYSIKHILQNDTSIYLTNNQFKDAMLECGFEPKDPDALNWIYAISDKSLAFVYPRVSFKDKWRKRKISN